MIGARASSAAASGGAEPAAGAAVGQVKHHGAVAVRHRRGSGRGGRDDLAREGDPLVGEVAVDQLQQLSGGAADALEVRCVGLVPGVRGLLG